MENKPPLPGVFASSERKIAGHVVVGERQLGDDAGELGLGLVADGRERVDFVADDVLEWHFRLRLHGFVHLRAGAFLDALQFGRRASRDRRWSVT